MRFYYDIQHGNYVWHPDQDSAHVIGPEISVLFDRECGTLLKHGTPSLVHQKYQKLSKALKENGMRDDLMVITGRIPLEKINHVIDCSGICHIIFDEEVSRVNQFQSAS